jgi:hypothetical protein
VSDETRDSVSFTATRSGGAIGLLEDIPWVHPQEGSPAANAYLLPREHP